MRLGCCSIVDAFFKCAVPLIRAAVADIRRFGECRGTFFLLIHDAVVGAFATGRTEAGTRLSLGVDITDTGKLTGLAPHTVVERTSVSTGLSENHVGAVFVTQMTILGHQVLLFWSEQQVVNQR